MQLETASISGKHRPRSSVESFEFSAVMLSSDLAFFKLEAASVWNTFSGSSTTALIKFKHSLESLFSDLVRCLSSRLTKLYGLYLTWGVIGRTLKPMDTLLTYLVLIVNMFNICFLCSSCTYSRREFVQVASIPSSCKAESRLFSRGFDNWNKNSLSEKQRNLPFLQHLSHVSVTVT